MPSLIYIVGAPRSGSTVLERVLHSAPHAFSVGEFHQLWRWNMEDLLCSCGESFLSCEFWGDFRSSYRGFSEDVRVMRSHEARMLRTWRVIANRYDVNAFVKRPEIKEYLGASKRLLAEVARVAGASVLIDSSKQAPRAFALADDPDTTILHLRRDPALALSSWRHEKWDPGLRAHMKQNVVRSAYVWARNEFNMRWLANSPRFIRMDYTDFVRSPRANLRSALGDHHRELVDSVRWLDDSSVMPRRDYHTLGGNPDRFEREAIHIRSSKDGLSDLALLDQISCRLFGAGLRQLFP